MPVTCIQNTPDSSLHELWQHSVRLGKCPLLLVLSQVVGQRLMTQLWAISLWLAHFWGSQSKWRCNTDTSSSPWKGVSCWKEEEQLLSVFQIEEDPTLKGASFPRIIRPGYQFSELRWTSSLDKQYNLNLHCNRQACMPMLPHYHGARRNLSSSSSSNPNVSTWCCTSSGDNAKPTHEQQKVIVHHPRKEYVIQHIDRSQPHLHFPPKECPPSPLPPPSPSPNPSLSKLLWWPRPARPSYLFPSSHGRAGRQVHICAPNKLPPTVVLECLTAHLQQFWALCQSKDISGLHPEVYTIALYWFFSFLAAVGFGGKMRMFSQNLKGVSSENILYPD